ncbi:MAG: aspartate/glutamate racemase family protein [Bacteroidota bacterium]
MKTLGLIGGTSYHSTIEYYRAINERVSASIGSDQNPTLLLYSINIELMRSGDRKRIKENYLEISRKLIEMGAEGIIICANTPHMVYNFVQPQIDVPILHIAESIGTYAKKHDMRSLGLLGTKATVKLGFIEDYLEQHFQIATVLPSKEHIERVHEYISKELTQGQFTDAAKSYFLNQMDELKNKGADAMILGCTELPQLIQAKDTDHSLIDTTDLHIDSAVDFILDQ